MSFGPKPWQQTSWDWRAAGNFIGGGAGSGLIVAGVLASGHGGAWRAAVFLGLALVGLGLTCVWLEIGRPWRALNVFLNPRTSWMSREAFVALLLFPLGAAALWWMPVLAMPVALLALAFLYCQSRMLPAARGIPAWRAPWLGPLVLCTGLTEGTGLALLAALATDATPAQGQALGWALGVLALARLVLWSTYRRHLTGAAPRAQAALDQAGRWLQSVGTGAPLLAAAVLLAGPALSPSLRGPAMAIAALAAWLPGAWLKYVLINRAGFNQGFALMQLPVRGKRRH